MGSLPNKLALLALPIIIGLILTAPGDWLDRADRVGYAVCHQLPDRTFWFGGRPLPLCARCSGQYLAALAALVAMGVSGRGRASRLPSRPLIIILALFLMIWGVDGLNSYLTLFPGLPYLYKPRNFLRVSTGALQGMALVAFFVPVFNSVLWSEPTDQPSLSGGRDLAIWCGLAVGIVALMESGWPWLLYPLAFVSVLGVLVLLTMVNSMIVTLALRSEGIASTWKEAAVVLLPGLALALIEITMIDLARATVTAWLGLPF
mgnify:CR=1 FL=1